MPLALTLSHKAKKPETLLSEADVYKKTFRVTVVI